jgi:hypothetical protein
MMKPIVYLLAALSLSVAMPLAAQTDAEHAAHHPDQKATAAAQDSKAPASSGKAAATPSMPMMAQMDEHMKKMQALHEKMMGAATPEERQEAMEDARKEMQESMTMMKPMMQGGGMMGGAGMMGGGMMAPKGKSADTGAQMQMMGKRMDMMQMMMQMMMDQQGMMAPPKSGGAEVKK